MIKPIAEVIPNPIARLELAVEDIEAGEAYRYIANLYDIDPEDLKQAVLYEYDANLKYTGEYEDENNQ
jgi:hypothetical protein